MKWIYESDGGGWWEGYRVLQPVTHYLVCLEDNGDITNVDRVDCSGPAEASRLRDVLNERGIFDHDEAQVLLAGRQAGHWR